jgi:hypothetical protein
MNINLGISLDGLNDVDSTGKATGDVLEWNAVTSKWEAATPSGGGAAGSNGQIQFNNSGAFGADSLLVWDNTNKRLGVGATPATTARLDVRAQGALSTDIAFRVRNSADAQDVFNVKGNHSADFRSSMGAAAYFEQNYYGGSSGKLAEINFYEGTTLRARIEPHLFLSDFAISVRTGFTVGTLGGFDKLNYSGAKLSISPNGTAPLANETLSLRGFSNEQLFIVRDSGQISVRNSNGVPSTNVIDRHWYYSADIVAGNAAPHFRTENGNVIKLYQQSSAGITTVADLVTILQNTGLLS